MARGGGGDDPRDNRDPRYPSDPRELKNINTYQLGAVEITAPQEPDANPTVVTVSKSDMENSAALDVAQALRYTPGLYNISTGTGSPAFYIRGFDERDIGYYLDGIPVNDIYTGNAAAATDLTPFFTFGLSSIQVSKGYTSPAFSMGKLGGAINMVTSVPVKNLEVNLGYKFIANNEHRYNIQVGRHLGNKYFQITFSRMDRKNLHYSYDHSWEGPVPMVYNGIGTERRGYMVSGKYGWYMGDNHEYSVNFYHQHEKMRGSQPANFSFPYYDKTGFYVLGDSKFTDLVSLNSKVWYNMNTNIGNFYDGTTGVVRGGSKYDDYSIGFTETAKLSFSEAQNLKIGLMLKNDNHEATDMGQTRAKRDWTILNSSLFAEYALKANDVLRFVVSGSWDRHDGISVETFDAYDATNNTSGTNTYIKKPNKHLNGWNLQGIVYVQPVESLLLHANVGHKSQIPKIRYLYEDGGVEYLANGEVVVLLGNENLRPESILNTELGADFDYKFEQVGTMKVGVTGYYNYIYDMLYEVNDTSNANCKMLTNDNGFGGSCVKYENATNGHSYGVEAYIKQGFFGDALTLGANYTYMERKSYDRDANGNKVQTRDFYLHPKQYINLSAVIVPAKEYSISLMGTILPRHNRYTSYNSNTTEQIATVAYFDLEMAYSLTKRLTLTAGAYNLFDKDYIFNGVVEATINHPRQAAGIPGRRVFAGVEYRY